MTVDLSSQIEIACPREQVAAYAADPDNIPAWYVNIKSVEWITAPPIVIGSQLDFVAEFLGKRLAYTYEVVEFVPGERLVMRTAEGPFPMETSYTWDSLESAPEHPLTRMTLRNRGEPEGFSRFTAPIMAMAIRRANRKDLLLLKKILEGQHP